MHVKLKNNLTQISYEESKKDKKTVKKNLCSNVEDGNIIRWTNESNQNQFENVRKRVVLFKLIHLSISSNVPGCPYM